MPAFATPLADPAAWTLSIVEVALPAGLRYAGCVVRALRAERAAGAMVAVPALGVLRRVAGADGREYVELQADPFPLRGVVAALAGGVPTFYLIFPDAVGIAIADGDIAAAAETLHAAATDVTLAVVFQDRLTRDPAHWAAELATASVAGGGNAALWQPFADAVAAQTASGARTPLLLLDHAGQPQRSGTVDLVSGIAPGEIVRTVTLDPADLGDLQRTVRRIDPAHPGLWAGGVASLRVRPARPAGDEHQLALLENAAAAVNEITVTPTLRHVFATRPTAWFAPQYAIPTGEVAPPLARYTRGNRATHFPNGFEYFDDLFRRLHEARDPLGRFDLTGWSMFPSTELTRRREGDPADLALTLEDAVTAIGAAGGSCRFLPARFIQLDPAAEDIAGAEMLAFHFLVTGILMLDSVGLSAARTDAAGAIILVGLSFGNALLMSHILSTGGATLEPNRDAVDVLDPLPNAGAVLSPFPATVADDTAVAQPVSGFPFDTLFKVVRHFGIYHQKFAIVRTPGGHFGYCGGIDLSPNRLDDAEHLRRGPFHDVQSKVEGPAVRDIALSFDQRWTRDGAGDVLPFEPPTIAPIATGPTDIIQVARTYFRPQDPARALAFAPLGDRTIADSLLAGIAQAREFIYIADQYLTPPDVYRTALTAKVADGAIRKLVIAIPSTNDQPFGELVRTACIAELRAADDGRGIVHIGYPRRRFTVADNDLRASSGRCLLGENLPASPGLDPTIALAPEARVPAVPFWLAVDGELMWVYDEAAAPPPGMKRLKVVRGADTRLVKGGAAPAGASPREHTAGAAATVVDLAGIYVHAKMMIVDDVFLTVGSANLNRRGLFHDGEINIFTMPEALRAAPANPIVALRRRLWCEMLDLPEALGGLMDDPVAAARLFERSPFFGNRYVEPEAFPNQIMLGATTGDALISTLLQGFVFGVGAINHVRLFDAIIDPSSAVESG